MCHNDTADAIFVLQNVGEIGDHEIHSQHLVLWEHEASVNNQNLAIALE